MDTTYHIHTNYIMFDYSTSKTMYTYRFASTTQSDYTLDISQLEGVLGVLELLGKNKIPLDLTIKAYENFDDAIFNDPMSMYRNPSIMNNEETGFTLSIENFPHKVDIATEDIDKYIEGVDTIIQYINVKVSVCTPTTCIIREPKRADYSELSNFSNKQYLDKLLELFKKGWLSYLDEDIVKYIFASLPTSVMTDFEVIYHLPPQEFHRYVRRISVSSNPSEAIDRILIRLSFNPALLVYLYTNKKLIQDVSLSDIWYSYFRTYRYRAFADYPEMREELNNKLYETGYELASLTGDGMDKELFKKLRKYVKGDYLQKINKLHS